MNTIEKIKFILTKPDNFFEQIKIERLSETFKYLILIFLPFFFLKLIYVYLYGTTAFSSDLFYSILSQLGVDGVLFVVVSWIMLLASTFIFAGLLHIFVKILKGHGKYSETFKASVYANTPYALFFWVPLVGFIFELWGLYLLIKGLAKLHEISMLRALTSVLILIFLLTIVLLSGVALLFITLTPTQNTPGYDLLTAKNQACANLIEMGCSDATISDLQNIPFNYDYNMDGTDAGDNLYDYCKKQFSTNILTNCKKMCGCL